MEVDDDNSRRGFNRFVFFLFLSLKKRGAYYMNYLAKQKNTDVYNVYYIILYSIKNT